MHNKHGKAIARCARPLTYITPLRGVYDPTRHAQTLLARNLLDFVTISELIYRPFFKYF